MQLGLFGLRTMGRHVARGLLARDHAVIGFDRDPDAITAAEEAGIPVAASLDEVVQRLEPPRALWVMAPSGGATRAVLDALAERLAPGDVVVDAGPSPYQDTRRRATMLHRRSLLFLDAGVNIGAAGPEEGFTLVIGGPEQAVERLRPVLDALAPEPTGGWAHVGPNGAGHYVQMVHAGIVTGVTQALVEGLTLLRHARAFDLDLSQIATTWPAGNLLPADLLRRLAHAVDAETDVDEGSPPAPDGDQARRLVEEALALEVPAPVLTLALLERQRFRADTSLADRLRATLHATASPTAPGTAD